MRVDSGFCPGQDARSAGDVLQIPAGTNCWREFPIYIGGLSSKMTDIYDRRAHTHPAATAPPAIDGENSAVRLKWPDNS